MGGIGSGRTPIPDQDRICIYCKTPLNAENAYTRKSNGKLINICKECNTKYVWRNRWKRTAKKSRQDVVIKILDLGEKLEFLKDLIGYDDGDVKPW